MRKFNRSALTALAVILSQVMISPSHAMVNPVNAPWSFGFAGLYLQPSFGGNGLGYSSFSNYAGNDDQGHFVGINGAPNHINNITPQFQWGFSVKGGWHFNDVNDAAVEWYQLSQSINGHLPIGTLFSGNFDGFYANRLQLKQSWYAFNVAAGHNICFDGNKNLRLHGGLTIADIQNQFINYPQLFPTSGPLFITKETLSYVGIGPRIGGDFNYNVQGWFNIYANGAASLLWGRSKQNASGYQNYTNSIYGFQPYGTPNYSQSHDGVIVTELESRIGLTFDYPLSSNTSLSFDAGYMWLIYLNAISSYTDIGIVGTADGASIGTNTTANFGLSGWYFGLTYSL